MSDFFQFCNTHAASSILLFFSLFFCFLFSSLCIPPFYVFVRLCVFVYFHALVRGCVVLSVYVCADFCVWPAPSVDYSSFTDRCSSWIEQLRMKAHTIRRGSVKTSRSMLKHKCTHTHKQTLDRANQYQWLSVNAGACNLTKKSVMSFWCCVMCDMWYWWWVCMTSAWSFWACALLWALCLITSNFKAAVSHF